MTLGFGATGGGLRRLFVKTDGCETDAEEVDGICLKSMLLNEIIFIFKRRKRKCINSYTAN